MNPLRCPIRPRVGRRRGFRFPPCVRRPPLGIDLAMEFPKLLTGEVAQAANVIVTMGCGDACPVDLDRRYLDWEIKDRQGKNVDEVWRHPRGHRPPRRRPPR